jgi:hypothetical protein
MGKVISPIVNYFLANNLAKDYTDVSGEKQTLITLNFATSPTIQQSNYFPSATFLDGDNATITAIQVVNGTTALTTLPNGQTNFQESYLNKGVLYISNLKREVIATLPLFSLDPTQNNSKIAFTWFNSQVWQNCYVEFTDTTFTTNRPLTLLISYIPKPKN